MIQLRVNRATDDCSSCDRPIEVAFEYSDESLTVKSFGFHHELVRLQEFSNKLKLLEATRSGEAVLVSQCECSVLRLRFSSVGGSLDYACRLILDFSNADDWFDKTVSFSGTIDSEHVGRFLSSMRRDIASANQTMDENGEPVLPARE